MISVHMIDRMFGQKQFDRLLAALAGNGLQLPLPVRAALLHSGCGVIALALRRLTELTYGPTDLARDMTRSLLDAQDEDGSFGQCPITTAAAAAALHHLGEQSGALAGGVSGGGYDPEVALAHERAIAAITAMQRDDGLFAGRDDRRTEDRELTSAFVLYMLAGDDLFRQTARTDLLMSHFDQRTADDKLDADVTALWRMARADSSALAAPSSALAAIAA